MTTHCWKWFVPGEGIAREVIQADICRYLGNDALVKPGFGTGEYEGVSGYYYSAYRALTSEMINDLKADSARWNAERARSRYPERAAYEDSQVHQSRQYYGPSAPAASSSTNTATGYSQYGQQSSSSGYPANAYTQASASQSQTYPNRTQAYSSQPSGSSYVTSGGAYPGYSQQGYTPASNNQEYSQYQSYPQQGQSYQPADPRNPQYPGGYQGRESHTAGAATANYYSQNYQPQSSGPRQPQVDQYGRPIDPSGYTR